MGLFFIIVVYCYRREINDMPMIKFVCNNPFCDNNITKVFQGKAKIPPFLDCGACGTGKLERTLGSPSSQSTQILDNGVQARQTEVNSVIIEQELDKIDRDE